MTKLLSALLLLPGLSFIAGCSASFAPEISEEPSPLIEGIGFTGTTYGGQSPITGAHIYIFAASNSGYGASSVGLIQPYTSGSYPSHYDSTLGAYYVVTDSSGAYQLARAQYSCTSGQQIYLYSLGGTATTAPNSAAGLMAVLGTCVSTGSGFSLVPANSYVYMNEVSTVAAAYAFAGFAVDATHVGSANTALSETGLLNAFNNAASMYSISGSATGAARSTTPANNGTVPAAEIDSIANSLANCVNSTGPTSIGCATLLADTKSGGTTGTTPTDTATAAINIAHNPAANVTAIFNNAGTTPAFGSPILAAAPNDFTIAINYTDSSLINPLGIAIDGSGNAWIADSNYPGVTKLSPTGALLATASGSQYGFFSPNGIAIDASENAWIADEGGVLIKTSSGAIPQSGSGYTDDVIGGSNDDGAYGVAIDRSGNIWVGTNSNVVDEFSSAGANETSDSGFPATNMSNSYGVAVDAGNNIFVTNDATKGSAYKLSQTGSVTYASGNRGFGYTLSQKNPAALALDPSSNVWMTNTGSNSVTKFTDDGASVSDYTTGFSAPSGIAFDGSGNAWVTNSSANTVTEISNSGTVISGSNGFTGAAGTAPTTSLNTPTGIAIDPSGNVWVTNNINSQKIVTEFIGAATPVVTPIVASLLSPYSAPASKP